MAARRELPEKALLRRYGMADGYVDCFAIDMKKRVSLAEYVEAFYTTGLFKLERVVLAAAGHSSSDVEARELAAGARDKFAVWYVTFDVVLGCLV